MSQRDLAEIVGSFGPKVTRAEDHAAAIDELRAWCRAVADYHGHKVAADATGRKRAALDQALAGNVGGHRIYLEDFVWFLVNEPGTEILDALIELRRDTQYTAEEKAEAALSAARQYLGSGEQHKGFVAAYQTKLRAQRRKAGE